MKAKEYVTIFTEQVAAGDASIEAANITSALVTMLLGLANEFLALTKGRGTGSPAAAVACFDEINTKYKSAVWRLKKECNILINPKGFEMTIDKLWPDLYRMVCTFRLQVYNRRELSKKRLERVK